MKCKHCNGFGWYYNDITETKKIKCECCDGTGEVEMTEQECLQTATTEQLAEALLAWWVDGADTYTQFGLYQHEIDEAKERIVEWLKQPHTIKE